MAAVTLGVAFSDSNAGNLEAVPITAFTPAVGDLLVVLVGSASTAVSGVLTDDQGGTYTRIGNATPRTELFVADRLVPSSVSTTMTITHTGDATAGVNVVAFRVSGLTRVGAAAVLQWLNADNGTSGTTPSVTLPAACLTGNPTLFVTGAAIAAPFVTEPSGWTERMDQGFTTPTVSLHASSRDSGFTGTTISAGNTVAAIWAAIAVELDTSAATATDESGGVARGVGRGTARGMAA
jgi:hypothetical protein